MNSFSRNQIYIERVLRVLLKVEAQIEELNGTAKEQSTNYSSLHDKFGAFVTMEKITDGQTEYVATEKL